MACRKHVHGGTLLEVLVSLIILTIIGTTLTEIAMQRRHAIVQARRDHLGVELAARWRSARLTGQAWARGDQGRFLENEQVRWVLESLGSQATPQARVTPDDHWRRLTVYFDESQDTNQASFVIRMHDVTSAVPAGGAPP